MASVLYYSPRQAAELLQESEEAVRGYIQEGRLKAQFLSNIMDYIILHEEMMKFLKEKKDFGTMRRALRSRLVLADRDAQVQDLIRLDVGRKSVQVRIATTDREVQLLLGEFVPDVLLVPLGATLRAIDPIEESIAKAKRAGIQVVVYHQILETVFPTKQDLAKHLEQLHPDVVINVSKGMAPLLEHLHKMFGLKS